MSGHVKTGQGLVAHGLGAALKRWASYAKIALVIVALSVAALVARETSAPQRMLGAAYAEARFKLWLIAGQPVEPTVKINGPRGAFDIPARKIAAIPAAARAWSALVHASLRGGALGAVLGVLVSSVWSVAMDRWGRRAARDKFVRGAEVVTAKALARITAAEAQSGALRLGEVPIPQDLETRHAVFVGSTGSGKTTAMRQILDGLEARGQCGVIYDTSGDFVSHYYSPERGDVILNPLDQRGVYWNPFHEIVHPADADRVASQLVTEGADEADNVWTTAARNLVANVMRQLWHEGRGEPAALIETLCSASKKELRNWLARTSSARVFEEDADRATASVLFMLSQTVSLLQYLKAEPSGAGGFSFQAFFAALDAHEGPKPWIFVPRREAHFEAMRPLLACWLECACGAILALEPHSDRRVWIMLDELPDMPAVDQLTRLLPQGRKFGAAVVITFQAIGQMRDRYGKDAAEALLGCCNTKLFLQMTDSDSRRWASQTIGDVEVEVRGATESLAFKIGEGRTSLAVHRQIRPALIDSEFKLPRFHGVLQLADGRPAARIVLNNRHIASRGPARHPAFVPGDIAATFWGQLPSRGQSNAVVPDGGPV